MIEWLRWTPSNVAPIPRRAVLDWTFREWVLNSTRFASSVSNAWVSWSSFASRFRPLRCQARADPRPADLEPLVLGRDRHVAAAADDLARLDVDGREGPLGAGLAVGEGRIDPAAQAGLILLGHDRPAPDGRIEGDRAQAGEVLVAQGLHPDAATRQDTLLHPRLRWHPRMVVVPLLGCRGEPRADAGQRLDRVVAGSHLPSLPGGAVRSRSGLRHVHRRARA